MLSLFKGFVPTKDKKSTMAFKGKTSDELLTYDEVKPLPEYAGILADDVVLIDIDDQDQAELMMDIVEDQQLDCLVIQTTRGKHFYFRNNIINRNGTNKSLAIGLQADIKLGSRTSYSVLKYDNKERFIEWDVEEGTDYQHIPKWLHPVNSKVDFVGMESGERNQSLFNYILTLQSNDLTVEEIKETIRIINKHVLKDPVSENELEVILRDDSFKKQSFFKGTKFLHDHFGNYLMRTHKIKKINGQLHIYHDGIYEPGYEKIERAMVKEISSLTDAKRKEVLKYLMVISQQSEASNPKWIAFNNGILNIESGELLPFNPEYVITNKIPWDYNPNAYDDLLNHTLNRISCNDPEIRMLLEEMIGATFYRSNLLGGGKCFILSGTGSNGKSTILNVLKKVLGKENYSVLDLKKLNDRFSTVMMYGKLANIGDDISDEYNADVSTFKKITRGEAIDAEQKGQPKFEFEPYSKLIFSANNIPHMKDPTGAAQKRLLIIPFNANFKESSEDFDPQISWKLMQQGSLEYFIKLGVEGLKRVLENKRFTTSSKVQKELDEFRIENNPILSFIDDVGVDEIENEKTSDVYKRYAAYCSQNNFYPVSKIKFSKEINRTLNMEVGFAKDENRKTVRVFKNQDTNDTVTS
ncbi:DNA primase [Alkaliphilus pronyensis]|uniref:DNA primase n=2 Tax=Alkaliphilus pronyensis TaxID=1482732 RepID=A0A6I0F0Z7_9FIRM|nr:DNA primase [Alkaliphilus pronyensis]